MTPHNTFSDINIWAYYKLKFILRRKSSINMLILVCHFVILYICIHHKIFTNKFNKLLWYKYRPFIEVATKHLCKVTYRNIPFISVSMGSFFSRISTGLISTKVFKKGNTWQQLQKWEYLSSTWIIHIVPAYQVSSFSKNMPPE